MEELADLFQAPQPLRGGAGRGGGSRSAARARCSPACPRRIGSRRWRTIRGSASASLSGRSAAEQGAPAEEDPEVLAELAELNAAYEERFGFRFVVFVNRRPRAEIVPVLRERLERTREEELETGCDELVAIAVDRWQSS